MMTKILRLALMRDYLLKIELWLFVNSINSNKTKKNSVVGVSGVVLVRIIE